jgi:MFS family permease
VKALVRLQIDTIVCAVKADYFGRRVGMASGCFITIFATFMQTFAPRGNLGCFIAGRVFVGIGQGMALSKCTIYPTISSIYS